MGHLLTRAFSLYYSILPLPQYRQKSNLKHIRLELMLGVQEAQGQYHFPCPCVGWPSCLWGSPSD